MQHTCYLFWPETHHTVGDIRSDRKKNKRPMLPISSKNYNINYMSFFCLKTDLSIQPNHSTRGLTRCNVGK